MATLDAIAESEIPLGFNGGVSPVPILDLSDEALAKLNGKQLVDLVTQHYWNIRPRALELRGVTVLEDLSYPLSEAAKALFRTYNHIQSLAINGKIYKKKKKTTSGVFILTCKGYDIIGLHLRPHSSTTGSLSDFAARFYISEAVAQKIIDENEVQTRKDPKRGVMLLMGQLADFFDRVLPRYDSPRYHQISSLPENPALSHIAYRAPLVSR